MKKDIEFIKQLLCMFESSEKAFITHTCILDNVGYNKMTTEEKDVWFNKYFHHINLMYDAGCIVTIGKNPYNTGITLGASGDPMISSAHMRLTDNGHNVLIALNNDTIWKKIKTLSGGITTGVLIEAGKKVTSLTLDNIFS